MLCSANADSPASYTRPIDVIGRIDSAILFYSNFIYKCFRNRYVIV